jgi:hypothetical protein
MGTNASKLLVQVAELVGEPWSLDAAERHLRRRADVRALTVIPVSPSRRFVRAVTVIPPSCRTVFNSGATCVTCQFAHPNDGGDVADRWTIVLPRTREALRAVTHLYTERSEPHSSLLRTRQFAPRPPLSPRQSTAIETAYRLGFYDLPRRTNLGELSKTLGVSRSTVAELLRRAEAKVLSLRLGS